MPSDNHTSVSELSQVDLESLPEDGGPDFNRLIFEKSPYLLQHARNPIDWRPWTRDTLDLAHQLDRPIFLSIGYSTCHWCHVMAEESFVDKRVAALLNAAYIPIKVDREERPDVDATYMQACQAMTGSGGWPLTLILTPDRLPFFAATYLPKDDRHGMIGLLSLLERIRDLWLKERHRIESSGQDVLAVLDKSERLPVTDTKPDSEVFGIAAEQYRQQYDERHGGFGTAPKFPAPHNLSLLLRLANRLDDAALADMALQTLRHIRWGGIYDQLGGGIHRYAVDERWLVPHFEKMLYDQALLVHAALDGWLYSGDPFFREMALDTADYIIRDLTAPDGGFCCGEDADSEGAEGTYYLWQFDEITDLFEDDERDRVVRLFGLTEAGNFEGKNILHLPEGLDEDLLKRCRDRLLPLRLQRPRPHRDDKVITAWNGLAISALARLGGMTGDERTLPAAAAAAAFLRDNLVRGSGRLLRRWRRGEAAVPGFLDDYACTIWGLLELYQARFLPGDLEWAVRLAREMLDLFDDGEGGLFDTGRDAETVLVRGRNLQDGALPSGNAVAAMVLSRLGCLTGNTEMSRRAEELLQRNWSLLARYPSAFSMSLMAHDYQVGPTTSLVIVAAGKAPTPLIAAAHETFRPRLEVLLAGDRAPELEKIAPIATGKSTVSGAATAWVCRDRTCLEPTTDPDTLKQLLGDG